MPAGYSFRPRAWPLALAGAACIAGVALGNWQAGRADEKRALGAQRAQAMRASAIEVPAAPVDAQSLSGRRVAAVGEFAADHAVFLDNRIRAGRAGYEVLMPLKLGNSPLHVLVNRGWIAAAPRRDVLPEVRTPAGTVRVEGIALERLPRALALGASDAGRLRQDVQIDAFAAQSGLALQPFFIQQHGGPADGLARDWPRPDAGTEKHQAYALQWYSLAGLAIALGLIFSFRRVAAP